MSLAVSRMKYHQMVAMILAYLLLALWQPIWSQQSIQFSLTDQNRPIVAMPHGMLFQSRDSMFLKVVRFYIHGIHCKSRGTEVWSSSTDHYLFDSESALTLEIPVDVSPQMEIDEIDFVIGVDSTLQCNGAHSGSLDPIWGMYWTWQSGYIHWKLETAIADNASVPALTWHVGGYRAPFNTLRVCRFTGLSNSGRYHFTLDIHRLIAEAHAYVPASVMSPSAHAMKLADIVQSSMQWQP
jgi:hypothetical protein